MMPDSKKEGMCQMIFRCRVLGWAGVLCLAAVLLGGQPAFANTSAERYAQAVQQLRNDGYPGIDTALARFEAVIRSDPAFTPAYVAAADALLVKYEFSKKKSRKWMQRAQRYLNTAIGRQPRAEDFYFKRALVRLNLEKTAAAESDLKRAVALRPDFLKAQVLYLQYLLSARRVAEARRLADRWIGRYGRNPAPRKYFGDLFFQARDYRQALGYYSQVVGQVKKAPNTYDAMGRAYCRLDKRKKAVRAFKKALEQDPGRYQTHFALGTCLSENGDLKGAIDHFRRYLKQVPDDAAAWNNLALLYERLGRTTDARLAWMQLKSQTRDKRYQQRAEAHLYRLASEAAGGKPAGGSAPAGGVKGRKSP